MAIAERQLLQQIGQMIKKVSQPPLTTFTVETGQSPLQPLYVPLVNVTGTVTPVQKPGVYPTGK